MTTKVRQAFALSVKSSSISLNHPISTREKRIFVEEKSEHVASQDTNVVDDFHHCRSPLATLSRVTFAKLPLEEENAPDTFAYKSALHNFFQ